MSCWPRALAIALFFVTGCAGAYVTPSAYAPMMKEAGDTRVTAGARLFAPARGMYARATVAATEHVRLGVQVAGASMKRDRFTHLGVEGEDSDRLRTLYVEGMAGFELPGRVLSWGVLPTFGHGFTSARASLCREPGEWWSCNRSERHQVEGSYLRSGLEAYVGFRPLPWANLAWGLRGAWVQLRLDELDGAPSRARHDLGTLEPFATARTEYGGFSFEMQLRYTNQLATPHDAAGDRLVLPEHLTFTLGVGVRLPKQPGRWAPGYWSRRES